MLLPGLQVCPADTEGGRAGRGRGVSGARRAGGPPTASPGGPKPGSGLICTRSPLREAAKSAAVGSGGGSGPGTLLCPPGSSEPVWPPLRQGRELLLITCPTCVLHTELKAQIILTTVPHSSPVLSGKQPLSYCTKRDFSRSPAAPGANLPAWNMGGDGRGVWVRALCKHNARRSAVIELRRCQCQERRALCARCQLQLPLRVPAAARLNPSHASGNWTAERILATRGQGHWGPGPPPTSQRQGAEQTAGAGWGVPHPGKAEGSLRDLEGPPAALLPATWPEIDAYSQGTYCAHRGCVPWGGQAWEGLHCSRPGPEGGS